MSHHHHHENDELDHLHEDVPANYYDTSIKRNFLQRYWHYRRFTEVGNLLHSVHATKILDVGCHGGTFSSRIMRIYPKATFNGIDVSKSAIAYAKKKYPKATFMVGRGEKIPYKANSFDLATCLEMMEHVTDPGQVLKEVHRVLKPHGSIVVLVPAENRMFQIVWFLWTHFGPGRVWNHTHVQKFKAKTLDALLKKNGFKVKKRKLFIGDMLLLVHAEKI